MKTYIKNIEGLNEFLGYENNEFDGEEIGYGERAFVFRDVTDLCNGKTKAEKLDDFMENADFGQSFRYKHLTLYKVRRSNGDAEVVYEDKNGNICQF